VIINELLVLMLFGTVVAYFGKIWYNNKYGYGSGITVRR